MPGSSTSLLDFGRALCSAFFLRARLAPAGALDITTDTDTSADASVAADAGGVSVGGRASVEASTSTTISGEPDAALAEGEATAEALHQQAEAAAEATRDRIGETVTTVDAAVAGTIRDVQAASDGMIDVRLNFNSDLGVESRDVTLRPSANAASSGSITLPMTAAEFVVRLEADASAG